MHIHTHDDVSTHIGVFSGSGLMRHYSCHRAPLTPRIGEQDRHHPSHDHSPNMAADACSAISIFLFVIAVAGFIAPALSELFLSVRG